MAWECEHKRSKSGPGSVADPGFPIRGGMVPLGGHVDLLGGTWTPNAGTFWQKCMRKRKNWVPSGEGGVRPARPLDPPMWFDHWIQYCLPRRMTLFTPIQVARWNMWKHSLPNSLLLTENQDYNESCFSFREWNAFGSEHCSISLNTSYSFTFPLISNMRCDCYSQSNFSQVNFVSGCVLI